jgi:hypothetical protein
VRNLRQEPAASLYTYVHHCGSVSVTRSGLPLLARDLCVRDRDMTSLIFQMTQRGQVTEISNVLRFSAQRQCVAKLGDFFPTCLHGMERAA